MNLKILLDESTDFDENKIKTFEYAINEMNNPNNKDKNIINQILEDLSKLTYFMMNSSFLLENNLSNDANFFILKSLSKSIKTKWKIIDDNLKNNFKEFILNFISYIVENNVPQFVINSANNVLIEIIKLEWCNNWDNAMVELINNSKKSLNICSNTLIIIKQLSEEIFEFSKNNIDPLIINKLKLKFYDNVDIIFQITDFVFEHFLNNNKKDEPELLKKCIDTVSCLIIWCPFHFIFETDLIDKKLISFFDYKIVTINIYKCLDLIVNIDVNEKLLNNDFYDNDNKQRLMNIHREKIFLILQELTKIMSNNLFNIDIKNVRFNLKININELNFFDIYLQNCSILSLNIIKNHFKWMIEICIQNENFENNLFQIIDILIKIMNKITEVDEEKLFKNCCEFWYYYLKNASFLQDYIKNNNNNPLNLGITKEQIILEKYFNIKNFLFESVNILVQKMQKPNEIRIIVNENNIPEREMIENNETSLLYEQMREIFIILSQISWSQLKGILSESLENQFKINNFCYDRLNSICWVIGSFKDEILSVNDEKSFLVYCIRFLLQLNESKDNKEDKIIIATNIMYVVSNFKRFLKNHWKFLITVLKKIYEFMEYNYEPIQEMACNTFIKLVENCNNEFSIIHYENKKQANIKPYVYDMIEILPNLIIKLNYNYQFLLLEGCSKMIKNCFDNPNKELDDNDLKNIVIEYLNYFHNKWIKIMNSNLDDWNNQQEIIYLLKCYITNSQYLEYCFSDYFKIIYFDLVNLFDYSNNYINDSLKKNMNIEQNYIMIRKNIVLLINNEIIYSKNKQDFVNNHFDILKNILNSFCQSPNIFKDVEVIILFTNVIIKLKNIIDNDLPNICVIILDNTLPLIKDNFEDFIEHRLNFFSFIKSLTEYHFNILFSISADKISLIINCIIWASKHNLSSTYEIGLITLNQILININNCGNENLINDFYKGFYIKLVEEILSIIFDGLHNTSYGLQCKILCLLIQTSNYLNNNIFNNEENNINFIYNHILKLMNNAYSNLGSKIHENIISDLFNNINNIDKFKNIIRGYKINLQTYSLN